MSATVFFESTNELATLTNTFSVGGTPADPTAVSLTITDPTQASTTYTFAAGQITKTGTGVYTKTIPCTIAGDWTYLWEGTTAASDAVGGTWTVHEVGLGKLYCTVETLKSRLQITNTVHDRELHDACFAASRAVEQFCDRHFWRTVEATVRTFEPHNLYCVKLPEFNDLVSVAALKTDSSGDGTFETTWAASDYQLLPYNPSAAPEQKPYTEIRAVGSQTFPVIYSGVAARLDRVQITGVFGWPAIPWGVKTGSALLAQELFKSKEAMGGAITTEFGVVRLRQSALMVEMLNPYSRHPHGPQGKIMVA